MFLISLRMRHKRLLLNRASAPLPSLPTRRGGGRNSNRGRGRGRDRDNGGRDRRKRNRNQHGRGGGRGRGGSRDHNGTVWSDDGTTILNNGGYSQDTWSRFSDRDRGVVLQARERANSRLMSECDIAELIVTANKMKSLHQHQLQHPPLAMLVVEFDVAVADMRPTIRFVLLVPFPLVFVF
ncbi:unnamed protein product [Cylindrotheca closterium]|uniref:Uncharacterized protein n=1 Tax=Cylindrotheca closterium TaxID=2856 RepID=A0AAD2CS57_9STRA|nr:unnamed protein product [Cylindrotheca closterium]